MTKAKRFSWILRGVGIIPLLGLACLWRWHPDDPKAAPWLYPFYLLTGTVAFILGWYSPFKKEDRMRCPDCGHDVPLKPEVVVEKLPCECGLDGEVRIARYVCVGFVSLMLTLFGSCWVNEHYSAISKQVQAPTEKATQPEKK